MIQPLLLGQKNLQTFGFFEVWENLVFCFRDLLTFKDTNIMPMHQFSSILPSLLHFARHSRKCKSRNICGINFLLLNSLWLVAQPVVTHGEFYLSYTTWLHGPCRCMVSNWVQKIWDTRIYVVKTLSCTFFLSWFFILPSY